MSLNFSYIKELKSSHERAFWRGGLEILTPLLEHRDSIDPISAIMEFGIGGGGKQLLWADMLEDVQDSLSIGVEIFHPEGEYGLAMEQEMFDWHMIGYNCSNGQFDERDDVKAFHGYNSYLPKTRDVIKDYIGDRLFDVIIDDSDPNTAEVHPEKYDLSTTWSSMIKQNGFIWSETINGQGTPHANEMSWEDHRKFHQKFAEMGWVIFDTTKFSHPDLVENIGHNNCVFSIWSHDHSQFETVYQKFEDCIISGKENI